MKKTIVYAGNIGEGQGLEKILPASAKLLGEKYQFLIVGDGGTKQKLKKEIEKQRVTNIELKNPVNRKQLTEIYLNADFLFLHLNNYKAFEKVLPSKIFELAAYNKPIIAGVSGYAHQFIQQNISNVILFNSCDVDGFVEQMNDYRYKTETRSEFIEKFKRSNINKEMALSIIKMIR